MDSRVTIYLHGASVEDAIELIVSTQPAGAQDDRRPDDADLSEHAGKAARLPGAGRPRVLSHEFGSQGRGGVPEIHAQGPRPVRGRALQHAGAARHAREHRARGTAAEPVRHRRPRSHAGSAGARGQFDDAHRSRHRASEQRVAHAAGAVGRDGADAGQPQEPGPQRHRRGRRCRHAEPAARGRRHAHAGPIRASACATRRRPRS